MADMGTTTNPEARLRLVAWLATVDAFAAARAELHRLGLDRYEPVDLLNDVAVRLLTADLASDIDNLAGYARQSLRLRAIDLFRGERIRAHEPLPDLFDDTGVVGPGVGDGDDPAETAALADAEDAIRRALFLALARTKAWVVAASLATLTLRAHPDVELPTTVPRPGGSATQAQTDRWAALWLAGEVDVFGDGDAARQARSRKLRQVEQLLVAVAGAVLDA
jgi:hypothetical protein